MGRAGKAPNFRIFTVEQGAKARISGLTIRDGRAAGGVGSVVGGEGAGGAIHNRGTLTLFEVAVTDNRASGGDGAGGGTDNSFVLSYYNKQPGVTPRNGGDGGSGGPGFGGGLYNSGKLEVSASTISGNTATDKAGGRGGRKGRGGTAGDGLLFGCQRNDGADGQNGADGPGSRGLGGGIWAFSRTDLTGVTVADNKATGSGGGAASQGGGIWVGGAVAWRPADILVARNEARSDPDAFNASPGSLASRGYNLVGKGSGSSGFNAETDQVGTSEAPIDPRLGDLRDNGGPTDTHALRPRSPALDKGNAFGLDKDQRGEQRPNDGRKENASGGDGSDIGAFEVQGRQTPQP